MSRARDLLISDHRVSLLRTISAARSNRRVLVARNFRVHGARHITTETGRLELGLTYRGFTDGRDGGMLRVRGALNTRGVVTVASGARLDIGPQAVVSLAPGVSLGPRTLLIATQLVTIGTGSMISWDCQILDSQFHAIDGDAGPRGVRIGDGVWVGTRVLILPGAELPNGCVVAAGSIVRGNNFRPHSLIGGAPARTLREDVSWR